MHVCARLLVWLLTVTERSQDFLGIYVDGVRARTHVACDSLRLQPVVVDLGFCFVRKVLFFYWNAGGAYYYIHEEVNTNTHKV
jgi:hypothetical protein